MNNNNNIYDLYNKFLNIKKMGFVESKRKGNGGIGYTFELLLGKSEENFPIPDFNGIEIKTCRTNTKGNIHLFSATPDGDFLFPIERVLKYLGYPDKKIPTTTIFNMNFTAKYFTPIGWYKEGKIVVNKEQKKVDFVARTIYGEKYPLDTSWSFKMLEDRLKLKLNYLAVVLAEVKFVNGIEFFHYNEIKFYKIKSFDFFISLIENGYIKICFNIGVFRNNNKKGKIHDRGVGFSINRKHLNLLYDEIKINFDQEVKKKKNNQLKLL